LHAAVVPFADAIQAGRIADGSDRSMTASMSVKIAVVPPIPSASVRTAVIVNTGVRRSRRTAYRILSSALVTDVAPSPNLDEQSPSRV